MMISVVCPTYNEADNLPRLIGEIHQALHAVEHEIIIADDDSPDRTWERAEEVARNDARVHVLRRQYNHGLGWSVIDGFSMAQGEAVACIDADLQHDPAILPRMWEALNGGADLVVGSRYVKGGGLGRWGPLRRTESYIATRLAQWLLPTKICDPMSGFFLLRRADFLRVRDRLKGQGFKILLEIVAYMPAAQVAEIPYTFRNRVAGATKLSGRVIFAYIAQLYRLWRLKSGARATRSATV